MTAVSVAARPKINLYLHVTGRREDGYHLLDSLVCFAETGDRITATPDRGLSLTINGPFGAGLDAGGGNLVMRAATALQGWRSKPGVMRPVRRWCWKSICRLLRVLGAGLPMRRRH